MGDGRRSRRSTGWAASSTLSSLAVPGAPPSRRAEGHPRGSVHYRGVSKLGSLRPVANDSGGLQGHVGARRIEITPHAGRVRVSAGGALIAETTQALALAEEGYPLRLYIPRRDVDMTKLTRSSHVTQCPWKGEASYFSAGPTGNAAWSYELPFANVAAIRGHLSFYPERVLIEVLPV